MGYREEFAVAQGRLLERAGVRARSLFLDVAAVTGSAHVLVAGEGPPVLLVPGFGDPAAMWAPLLAHLPGVTAYAVDRPCFGLTGAAPLETRTLRSLAVEFLTQVLDALGLERTVVIGNSVGSQWSLWLAMSRPDRVTATAHLGCPAFLTGTSAPLPLRLLSVPPLGWLLMRLTPATSEGARRFGERVPREDLSPWPELCDLLAVGLRRPGARLAVRQLVRAMTGLRGGRPEIEITPAQLREIRQPAQLQWGSRDPFGSVAAGRRAAELLPDASFSVIEGAGHAPWINHGEEAGQRLRPFLLAHATA